MGSAGPMLPDSPYIARMNRRWKSTVRSGFATPQRSRQTPLHSQQGYPQAERTDNGPGGFTTQAFMAWAQTYGIPNIMIQPGNTMQDGYFESGSRTTGGT